MSGGVCRQQGIIQWPLSMFGHPSPHHHSGILKPGGAHTHTHTKLCTHPFNSESSLVLCKLDREEEYDNKQPYVRGTRNNILSFLCCLIFLPVFFSSSSSIMEVLTFKARTPPPSNIATPPPPPPPSRLPRRGVCLSERVKRAHPRA